MFDNRAQIEAVSFKPVDDGFIYRAPNPWLFGHADHYRVDAAQKAALLDVLVAPRPGLRKPESGE